MLLNMIFRCMEILVYFLSCDPENQVALRQVVRKQVSFQDHKKEKTLKFPNIEI